jgi:hypothetical protein
MNIELIYAWTDKNQARKYLEEKGKTDTPHYIRIREIDGRIELIINGKKKPPADMHYGGADVDVLDMDKDQFAVMVRTLQNYRSGASAKT